MIKKYEAENIRFVQNINNATGLVNKGKLVLEDTPPNEALAQLNEIKIRSLDKFKE